MFDVWFPTQLCAFQNDIRQICYGQLPKAINSMGFFMGQRLVSEKRKIREWDYVECHWGWLTAALIEAICLSYKLKYLHFILEMQMPFLRDFPKLLHAPRLLRQEYLGKQCQTNWLFKSAGAMRAGGGCLRKGRSFVGVTIYAFGPRNVECILQFSWPARTFSNPFCCNRI